MVVAFQALQALQCFHSADENPTDLGGLVVGALNGCFHLLSQLEEPDNRISVLKAVMVLLRSFSKIREDANMQQVQVVVVQHLQALWREIMGAGNGQDGSAQYDGIDSERDLSNLPLAFRAKLLTGILSAVTILIDAFRDDALNSPALQQMLHPLLQIAVAPSPFRDLLIGEGLKLWGVVLQHSTPAAIMGELGLPPPALVTPLSPHGGAHDPRIIPISPLSGQPVTPTALAQTAAAQAAATRGQPSLVGLIGHLDAVFEQEMEAKGGLQLLKYYVLQGQQPFIQAHGNTIVRVLVGESGVLTSEALERVQAKPGQANAQAGTVIAALELVSAMLMMASSTPAHDGVQLVQLGQGADAAGGGGGAGGGGAGGGAGGAAGGAAPAGWERGLQLGAEAQQRTQQMIAALDPVLKQCVEIVTIYARSAAGPLGLGKLPSEVVKAASNVIALVICLVPSWFQSRVAKASQRDLING
jgi:hypothetical protein